MGYILKVCGKKGDFEDKPEPPKVEEPPPKKKKEEKKQLTRGAKIFKGSKDLPTKAQVDADQVSFFFKKKVVKFVKKQKDFCQITVFEDQFTV